MVLTFFAGMNEKETADGKQGIILKKLPESELPTFRCIARVLIRMVEQLKRYGYPVVSNSSRKCIKKAWSKYCRSTENGGNVLMEPYSAVIPGCQDSSIL